MDVKNLIPWNRNKSSVTTKTEDEGSPFLALHREMNRLFDDFFHGFEQNIPASRFSWSQAWPKVDVSDSGNDVKISVELPGMEEKDVELTLRDGVLTLRGEKKSETQDAHYSERWYGQFQRSIQLGPDIDPEKVSAAYKNGLLTVTVAKKPEEQRVEKRIPING